MPEQQTYEVNFGGQKFKASWFEFQLFHPSDNSGMPGKRETRMTLRVWVRSSLEDCLDPGVRKELFKHANFHRGDTYNEPQTLTITVRRAAGGTPHTYTLSHAWLESYFEYQAEPRDNDYVVIEVKTPEPGQQLYAEGKVQPGETQPELRMELYFRGFMADNAGSAIAKA